MKGDEDIDFICNNLHFLEDFQHMYSKSFQ